MRPLFHLLCALPLLAGIALADGPAANADTSDTMTAKVSRPTAKVDEKSQAVLKSMTDYFAKADAVHLKIKLVTKVNDKVIEEQNSGLSLSAARPNKYFRSIEQGGKLMEIRVSDGTSRYFYFEEAKAYDTGKAPAKLDEIIGKDGISEATLFGPLLRENNLEHVLGSYLWIKYDRESEIEGRKVDVLKFERREGEGELLVRTGDMPVPEKVILKPHQVAMTFEFTYSDWKFGKDVDQGDFTFKAPEGSKKVRSVASAISKLQGGAPLLGEQAPDFLLQTPDGKDVKLVDYKGKVLILDFWATWCGPCRKGLPVLAEVAGSYKDKGVVLHAVNLRETKEVVEPFAKSFSNPINVLMDPEGKTAEKYQVNGIPHTVIIDKTGKIQVVHVGLSDDYAETLREELDAILAGQDISKE